MAFAIGSSARSAEINVTPLIDVLLVLLIIFMVIVPVMPRGLESSVPRDEAPSAPSLPPVIVKLVAGAAAGSVRYSLGERGVEHAELLPALAAMFAARQDRTLFIEADRSLTYQQVAAVVSEGRQAGAGQVALSGSPK